MFRVVDIIEPDFGCEGLPDGQEICCEVVFESEAGRVSVKIPDAELYRQRIDVGSEVSYENDVIKKLS